MRRHATINRAARSLAAAGIALAAVVAVIAFGSTDAAAQGFNVVTFGCTSNGSVQVDVRGLGNTNVCVFGSLHVEAECACANNGGNCTSDANKNTVTADTTTGFALEPKNGRVNTTISPISSVDICSANLSCPSGQTAKTVHEDVDATYLLCATTAAAGDPCTCTESNALATAEDGSCDTSANVFVGRKNSCLNLFQ